MRLLVWGTVIGRHFFFGKGDSGVNIGRFFAECDGVIHSTNKSFEGEAVTKWQEWFGSRPVFSVGPLSPPASAADIAKQRELSPAGQEVETFLNGCLDKFGPSSVVYVCHCHCRP